MRDLVLRSFIATTLVLLLGSLSIASSVNGSSVIIAKSPWVDVQEFANLSAAVASTSTEGKTIFIGTTIDCNDDLYVPSDRAIKLIKGGIINIAANRTLTIDGPFEAGIYQVFTGSGKVVLGGRVVEAYPQWMGAIGDGVSDDTEAINRCFAASSKVHIPSGVYMVDSVSATGIGGILITKDNTNVELDEDVILKVIPNGSTTYNLLNIMEADNVTIIGGRLRGDRSVHDYTLAGTHEFGIGIRVFKSTNVTIERVKIEGFTGDAILIIGENNPSAGYNPSRYIKIRNCLLDSSRRNNISIVVGTDVVIEGNIISDAGINDGHYDGTAPKMGIDIEGGSLPSRVIISNNIFRGNLAGSVWSFNGNYVDVIGNIADTGIGFQNSSNVNISNNIIANLADTKGSAIAKTTGVAKPLTSGTMLSIGARYQIVSRATLDFTAIGSVNNSGGTWFTATGTGPLGAGDSVLRTNDNIIITGNLLQGFATGIAISKGARNILINGNSLTKQAIAGITSDSDDVAIVNNKLTSQAIGVRLNDGVNVTVKGNEISTVSNRAIYSSLGRTTVATISDNIIRDFTNSINPAIDVSSGNSMSVINNLLDLGGSNTAGYGIGNGVVGTVISGNVIQNTSIATAAIATTYQAAIAGNKLLNVNAPKGIYISGEKASGSLVSSNIVQLNVTGDNKFGIYLKGCSNARVINNEVHNPPATLTNAINTAGATSSLVIKNISTAGNFRTAPTDMASDNVTY